MVHIYVRTTYILRFNLKRNVIVTVSYMDDERVMSCERYDAPTLFLPYHSRLPRS